jgi:hypothetical protein
METLGIIGGEESRSHEASLVSDKTGAVALRLNGKMTRRQLRSLPPTLHNALNENPRIDRTLRQPTAPALPQTRPRVNQEGEGIDDDIPF